MVKTVRKGLVSVRARKSSFELFQFDNNNDDDDNAGWIFWSLSLFLGVWFLSLAKMIPFARYHTHTTNYRCKKKEEEEKNSNKITKETDKQQI